MTTMLHASNFPLATTEEMLAIKFAKFGQVLSVRIELDGGSAARRRAFVEMHNADGARRAINALHLADFDGKLMSVYTPIAK